MRKTVFLAALLTCLVFARITPALAVSLGFTPGGSFSAVNGNNYSFDLVVSGLLSGGQLVSAYNLDVLYNPAILNVSSVAYASGLGNPDAFEVLEGTILSSGRINIAALSLLSDSELAALQGTHDSLTLATLTFAAVTAGPVNLAFDWFPPSGGKRDIKGALNLIIYDGSSEQTPVPEPGTLLLIGAGILPLWLFYRKKTGNIPR